MYFFFIWLTLKKHTYIYRNEQTGYIWNSVFYRIYFFPTPWQRLKITADMKRNVYFGFPLTHIHFCVCYRTGQVPFTKCSALPCCRISFLLIKLSLFRCSSFAFNIAFRNKRNKKNIKKKEKKPIVFFLDYNVLNLVLFFSPAYSVIANRWSYFWCDVQPLHICFVSVTTVRLALNSYIKSAIFRQFYYISVTV